MTSTSPGSPFDDLDPAAVLTAQDVADRLLVDARSVRRAVARGDLRASRACGLRILAADAAAWWSAGIRPPRPAARAAVSQTRALPRVASTAPAGRRGPRPGRLPLPPKSVEDR